MNIYATRMQINILWIFIVFTSLGQIPESDFLKGFQFRLEQGEIFRAELEYTYTDSFTNDVTESYGSIWFSRHSYKIETADQVVLVHNGLSKVFNRHRNNLIISNYIEGDDDFAPSRFFRADEGRFHFSESVNVNGNIQIDVKFSDPFDLFRDATIIMNKTGLPLEIEAFDQAENKMVSRFKFGRFLAPNEEIFSINHPSDTEIIDLRD